jgi:transmembrane sensor
MEEGGESAQARASREASAWLILLQEEPDDAALRRRFEEWRRANPVHRHAWAAMEHVSGVASGLQPDFADRWRPHVARSRAEEAQQVGTEGRGRFRPKRRWALAGAAMALAACLAFVAGPVVLLHFESDYMTGTAEQRTLGLQDGSEVTLAAGSAIAVSYEAGERRVRLLAGEAFFKVMADPGRPFRVAAADAEASVLGTSFGVRLEPRGVSVAVAEGIVQVGYPDRAAVMPQKLEAGQGARLSADGRISRTSIPTELVASWRRGQLYLRDETMRDAVDQLRRYYAGTIILADDALAERRVTGVYNLDDPEDALLGIVRAHGARLRHVTPWLIVLSGA